VRLAERGAALLLLAALGLGCSARFERAWPPWGAERAEPAAASAAPEPGGAAAPAPAPPRPRPAAPAAAQPPPEEPPPAAEPVAPDPAPQPRTLAADLERGESRALLSDADARIMRAEHHLRRIDAVTLGSDARLRLEMTRNLLDEARAAAAAGDPVRAAALAEKAEILAADLAGR